jgi:hypothetical protein
VGEIELGQFQSVLDYCIENESDQDLIRTNILDNIRIYHRVSLVRIFSSRSVRFTERSNQLWMMRIRIQIRLFTLMTIRVQILPLV